MQRAHAVEAGVGLQTLGGIDSDLAIALQQPVQRDSRFDPCKRRADAEMDALAKRQMRIGPPIRDEGIRLPLGDVKGTVHTYSTVLLCHVLGLDPAREPNYVEALRNPDWNLCQYGIRVYAEFLQQMNFHAAGHGVPHDVTEWNSLVGRVDDSLADPAWPCNNYPAGLLENAVAYLNHQPHLMGFAIFVDRDMSCQSPFWLASAARGYLAPADLDAQQQARLRDWDMEFNTILERGAA